MLALYCQYSSICTILGGPLDACRSRPFTSYIYTHTCSRVIKIKRFLGSRQIKTGTVGWAQRTITLTAPRRGCHLITADIIKQVPELRTFKVGMANIFLKHTSASLTINENVGTAWCKHTSAAAAILTIISSAKKRRKVLAEIDA